MARGPVGGLRAVADPAVPDVELVQAEPVLRVRVLLVAGLRLNHQLVLEGELLVQLPLDPAVVLVPVQQLLCLPGLGLDHGLRVLQVALHLVTGLQQHPVKGGK